MIFSFSKFTWTFSIKSRGKFLGLPFKRRSMLSPELAAFSNAIIMMVGEENTSHMELIKHESYHIFQCSDAIYDLYAGTSGQIT